MRNRSSSAVKSTEALHSLMIKRSDLSAVDDDCQAPKLVCKLYIYRSGTDFVCIETWEFVTRSNILDNVRQ